MSWLTQHNRDSLVPFGDFLTPAEVAASENSVHPSMYYFDGTVIICLKEVHKRRRIAVHSPTGTHEGMDEWKEGSKCVHEFRFVDTQTGGRRIP